MKKIRKVRVSSIKTTGQKIEEKKGDIPYWHDKNRNFWF